ncbi:MAG: hypothetical protein JXR22_10845, partial [Prolixibacteraceae bacterium]|nr:hypothetical protein [Prolixibacteraceae bacterium]
TFISSSTLTKAGKFAIREGLSPSQQWGPNATIDVSLYGSASTIALFPELQKSLMRAHKDLQTPAGEINHGLGSDLDYTQNGTWGVYHRVDLVPNYIQLVLRDFFWTNDQDYLIEMWPSIVKGLAYILNERDKDKDLMPDMEGIMCSYDNFPMYGLASYIQSQWLAAMAMTHQAAQLMNDHKTMDHAAEILEQGKKLMEEKLWNGSYYSLSNDVHGEHGVDDGILTDQLIGQWLAHQAGMDYLFPKEHIDKSLDAIMQHSYIEGFGLRNCSWPKYPQLFPIHESDLWVDQANTCWSGVELGFAALLLYEGKEAEALKVIKTVDERYRKAGLYWDHQEFGGHYYRPLSAWSIINGYLGLGVNNGSYRFSPKTGNNHFKVFFSYGNGMAYYNKLSNSKTQIEVISGKMLLRALVLDTEHMGATSPNVYVKGNKLNIDKRLDDHFWHLQLKSPIMVNEGEVIVIE